MSMLHTPAEGAVLNPLVIVENAGALITFVSEVFGVQQNPDAYTELPDGSVIHSELRFGTVNLVITDRADGWPSRPALLQVWVEDAAEAQARAVERGATVVIEPTPFYGETTLARFLDPWQNLWWLYAPAPGSPDPLPHWSEDGGSDTIHATLDAALRALSRGPDTA